MARPITDLAKAQENARERRTSLVVKIHPILSAYVGKLNEKNVNQLATEVMKALVNMPTSASPSKVDVSTLGIDVNA